MPTLGSAHLSCLAPVEFQCDNHTFKVFCSYINKQVQDTPSEGQSPSYSLSPVLPRSHLLNHSGLDSQTRGRGLFQRWGGPAPSLLLTRESQLATDEVSAHAMFSRSVMGPQGAEMEEGPTMKLKI